MGTNVADARDNHLCDVTPPPVNVTRELVAKVSASPTRKRRHVTPCVLFTISPTTADQLVCYAKLTERRLCIISKIRTPADISSDRQMVLRRLSQRFSWWYEATADQDFLRTIAGYTQIYEESPQTSGMEHQHSRFELPFQ
ncbi:hypothetical protein EVAR_94439_1 [Eumeta japonica]|uniref:Uncharacterized protein n=1 Tax=Eumeta variegata TaxID=151549 RepID=A0A4C1TQ36_EUMVA|nr:hypothetical protein EVAR_94439_1 [Eumeta japonica]